MEDLLICSLQIWLLPLPGGQSSSLGKDQGGKGESDFLYSDKKKNLLYLYLYSLVKGHIPQLDWIIVPLFVKFQKSSDLVIGNKVATDLCER